MVNVRPRSNNRKTDFLNLSEDEPEYRKRMKTGVYSRKDGWKSSEEIDYDSRWRLETHEAAREDYLRKQREGERIE